MPSLTCRPVHPQPTLTAMLPVFQQRLPDDGSVHITNVGSTYATIGVWGLKARDLVQLVSEDDFANEAFFPYLTVRPVYLEHLPVLAARISYAGELGWELYTPTEYGLKL